MPRGALVATGDRARHDVIICTTSLSTFLLCSSPPLLCSPTELVCTVPAKGHVRRARRRKWRPMNLMRARATSAATNVADLIGGELQGPKQQTWTRAPVQRKTTRLRLGSWFAAAAAWPAPSDRVQDADEVMTGSPMPIGHGSLPRHRPDRLFGGGCSDNARAGGKRPRLLQVERWAVSRSVERFTGAVGFSFAAPAGHDGRATVQGFVWIFFHVMWTRPGCHVISGPFMDPFIWSEFLRT